MTVDLFEVAHRVFNLIRQPVSFLNILPVRKRQSSLKNVILRPYYAVYFLECDGVEGT